MSSVVNWDQVEVGRKNAALKDYELGSLVLIATDALKEENDTLRSINYQQGSGKKPECLHGRI